MRINFNNHTVGFAAQAFGVLLISILHLIILNFGYKINMETALIDTCIFNLILLILSFVIIYPVKYILFDKLKFFRFLFNHFISSLIISIIWVSTSYYLIINIFALEIFYLHFLNSSLYWRMLFGVILYFSYLSIYYLISFYNDLIKKSENEKELRLLVKEAELKALRYQINPHFLFNSFNSINYLIPVNPVKASKMLITISDYFRNTFSHDDNDFSSLKDEIENISRYLAIEKIRFEEKIDLKMNVDESALNLKIPHMILQPLFENIIKHAVHDAINKIQIEFNCKPNENYLCIELLNNFEESYISKTGAGIGLQNIQSRMLNIYGSKDLFSFSKLSDKFFVSLKIPIEK